MMDEYIPNIKENPKYCGDELNTYDEYDIIEKTVNNFKLVMSFDTSDEEIYKKYAQLPKEKLLEILVSKDKQINELTKQLFNGPIYYDNTVSKHYYDCSDWQHCSNPHRDCVNCPLFLTNKQFDENNNYGYSVTCYETIDVKTLTL